MKITQQCNLDLSDATKDPLYYFKGCEGETVIMDKAEFVNFLTHPLVLDKLYLFRGTLAGLNIEVRK